MSCLPKWYCVSKDSLLFKSQMLHHSQASNYRKEKSLFRMKLWFECILVSIMLWKPTQGMKHKFFVMKNSVIFIDFSCYSLFTSINCSYDLWNIQSSSIKRNQFCLIQTPTAPFIYKWKNNTGILFYMTTYISLL